MPVITSHDLHSFLFVYTTNLSILGAVNIPLAWYGKLGRYFRTSSSATRAK